MEDKIRKIMDESTDYQTGEVDAEIAISKLLDLFDVSYSVFDHETIQRIRNSSSDAEVRRMIKSKIQKL